MLYEFNGKIYVKPFSNKIVEVEMSKNENENFDIVPTTKIVYLTPEIKEKMVEVTNEEAYKILNAKKSKTTI